MPTPRQILQPERSALELLAERHRRYLPMEVRSIDALLQGGLQSSSLIEVAGEAGVGKSQMCIHLTANMLLQVFKELQLLQSMPNRPLPPSSLSRVLYINTTGMFRVERLRNILIHRLSQYTSIPESTAQQLLDWLFVEQLHDEELHDVVERRLPLLYRCYDVRLVIIDSIADPFRMLPHLENNIHVLKRELSVRSAKLLRIAALLKYYSSLNKSHIVITNQVTKSFKPMESMTWLSEVARPNANKEYSPCLGLSWSNCVNVRLMITKTGRHSSITQHDGGISQQREMHAIFNSNGPAGKASFIITNWGIADCPN